MKTNNLPEISFQRFTCGWEKHKLGEVFEQTSEYVNPKVENLELWSLTVENGLTPKTERYNREFLVKKVDQFKAVSDNEFIYNPMNMTLGAVDLNLTGKKVAVSGYYITMKTTANYDSKYFRIWLKSPLAIKMYKLFATGSLIERQRVQFPTLSKIKALIPSKDEQLKIGEFFKQLEDTITLQEQELTTLKQTKKGFLQKMFPKEGESVPEVRFSGFTGDWEQRKLREMLAEPVTDGPHETPKLEESGIPFISVDAIVDNQIDFDRKRGYISEDTDELYSKKYRPQYHDVFLVKSGSTVGKTAIVETKERFNIWSPLAAMRVGEVSDPYFLYFLLQTRKIQNQVKDKASSGTQPNLGMRELEKFHTQITPNLEEQKKIGAFFQQLDNLITLHQRELDALKETKKAFLQKMFV